MMKRFSFCAKKLIFCTIFTLVCFVAFSTDNNWTLAAQKFNFTQKDVVSDYEKNENEKIKGKFQQQTGENNLEDKNARKVRCCF